MIEIMSLLPEEISEHMAETGQPGYRAKQIFEWLHRRGAVDFSEMNNLPEALRRELAEIFFIPRLSVAEKLVSKDNETAKFLTRLSDGSSGAPDVFVESVLMRYKHGDSVCISTQAGCKMGCKFCASAESGFQRDLTAGEMCLQVYNAGAVKNIVLMGCGEPLDNFDATFRFIELIGHPLGKNIGGRHITVSTCGLVPQIYALAEWRLQITLAVSLHAPCDEIRKQLMPVAKTYPLSDLMAACKHYAETTRRRITFEYALVKGLNGSPSQAKALSRLLRGLLCHVNLIPVNKARGEFSPAPRRDIEIFAEVLREAGVEATVRRSLGADINAACGQLRLRKSASA